MNGAYGWVITFCSFPDETPGIHGPAGCPFTPEQIKSAGAEFRIKDCDDEVYYTGYYLGPDDETLFKPLDDYGMPNAGATTIEYRSEAGQWEAI